MAVQIVSPEGERKDWGVTADPDGDVIVLMRRDEGYQTMLQVKCGCCGLPWTGNLLSPEGLVFLRVIGGIPTVNHD